MTIRSEYPTTFPFDATLKADDLVVQQVRNQESWRENNPVWRLAIHPHTDFESIAGAALSASRDGQSPAEWVDDPAIADLVLLVGPVAWACEEVQRYRSAGRHCPIVTVCDGGKGNALLLLSAGADDHLEVPFDTSELRARMHALLRRSYPRRALSEVSVDRQAQLVRVRHIEARLARKPLCIFLYLLERRDRWTSAAEIIAKVCGTHHRNDTSLVRVHIHAIRTALGEMRSCIRSDIGGRGYMFSLNGL
jgi:DNA-binding response OmpR family regulator